MCERKREKERNFRVTDQSTVRDVRLNRILVSKFRKKHVVRAIVFHRPRTGNTSGSLVVGLVLFPSIDFMRAKSRVHPEAGDNGHESKGNKREVHFLINIL